MTSRLTLPVLAVCLLTAGLPVLAQNISVEGTVTMKDGGPVAEAEVKALPSTERRGRRVVKTGDDGTYRIPFAEFGVYNFVAEKKGLLMYSMSVEVRSPQKVLEEEREGQIGPEQKVPEFNILPGRSVEVHFVMVAADHFQKAERAARKAEEINRIGEANALTREGKHAESDEILKAVLEGDPDNAAAHYLKGLNAVGTGRSDEASALFEKAHTLDQSLAGVCAQRGVLAHAAGRYDEAAEWFRREQEISPDSKAVALNLAMTLAAAGKKEEAIAAYGKVIELDPSESGAYLEMASLHTELGQDDEAAAVLEQMEKIARPDPAYWFNIGANHSNEERFDEAEKAYRKALAIDTDFPEANREMGYLLVRQGDMKAAVTHFEAYLRVRPDAKDSTEIRSMVDALKGAGG